MALVDIFVPCYNAGKFLQEMIESIKAQTYQDYKVIFIDDGSTDDSVEIIKKYAMEDSRVRLIQNDRNHGVQYTRNRGLVECHAPYIALMDADDIMPSYRLEHQMKYLLEHPECDIVSGNYQLISESGQRGNIASFGEWTKQEVYANLFFWDVIANGSAIIKKKFIDENKLMYDESFPSVGDYNFWVDCMLAGAEMHIMNEILEYYRVVETGVSRVNSRPDKIARRMECFNLIHSKIVEHYNLPINRLEKRVYFEYTNEISKSKYKKIKDFPVFFILCCKLKYYNPFHSNFFIEAIKKFRKMFYHF